jgi:hypothetical protein
MAYIMRYSVKLHGTHYYIADCVYPTGPTGKLFTDYYEASALADRLNHWANWS